MHQIQSDHRHCQGNHFGDEDNGVALFVQKQAAAEVTHTGPVATYTELHQHRHQESKARCLEHSAQQKAGRCADQKSLEGIFSAAQQSAGALAEQLEQVVAEQGSEHETREHNLIRHMLVLFLRQQAHPGGPVKAENQDGALAERTDAHEHEGLSVGAQRADCVVEVREEAGEHEARRVQVLLPRHGHVQSAQREHSAAQSRAAHVTGRGRHLSQHTRECGHQRHAMR
mmetsp:Transcript_13932/g.24541  ORF Transcript_13932/g.24541 Transcript_13932/m.24541 type:complete len:228 (-) Transcript_13932:564-1247(-)